MALVEFQNNSAPYINADNLNNNFTECYNIVESGSNENGNYIKYSDGTMICYKKHAINSLEMTTRINNTAFGYINASNDHIYRWTFPVQFINAPCVNANVSANAYTQTSLGGITNTDSIIYITTSYPATLNNVTIQCMAIGKWK